MKGPEIKEVLAEQVHETDRRQRTAAVPRIDLREGVGGAKYLVEGGRDVNREQLLQVVGVCPALRGLCKTLLEEVQADSWRLIRKSILFNLPRRASHRNNDPSRRMW